MTKLNQIVAIEKDVKAKGERAFTTAYHTIQKAPLLSGISRSYEPKDEDGDRYPSESTLPQVKVEDVIKDVNTELGRIFDIALTKDTTNASIGATAAVTVDGVALTEPLTVPSLLFIEKKLVDIRTFVSKLPTLDPSEVWTYDPNVGAYATEVKKTVKTKKIPRVQVLYEATDKHPAQVQAYNEDVLEGYWSTIKFSGAVPAERVLELLARVDKVTEAVKFARETANQADVIDRRDGRQILEFIFG